MHGQVLYKASSPGGDTITYLLGSFHVLPRNLLQLDAGLDSLISTVDTYFTESFYLEKGMQPLAHLRALQKAMSYPNGKRLSDFVSRDEEKLVYDYYRTRYRIKKSTFRQLSTIIPAYMHQIITHSGNEFIKMDRELLRTAERGKKRILNLDHIPLVVKAYQSMLVQYPPSWLVNLAKDDRKYLADQSELQQAYLRQDTAALIQIVQRDAIGFEKERFNVIDARNIYWINELQQQSGTKNFIVAGVAHLLCGEYALLKYYTNSGYKVEAIPTDLTKIE